MPENIGESGRELYLGWETVLVHENLLPPIKPPANYRDEEKIKKWIEQKSQERLSQKRMDIPGACRLSRVVILDADGQGPRLDATGPNCALDTQLFLEENYTNFVQNAKDGRPWVRSFRTTRFFALLAWDIVTYHPFFKFQHEILRPRNYLKSASSQNDGSYGHLFFNPWSHVVYEDGYMQALNAANFLWFADDPLDMNDAVGMAIATYHLCKKMDL